MRSQAKRKKAKFRAGQRVMITKLRAIITEKWPKSGCKPGCGFYVSVAGFTVPVYCDEMRPLTAKERGPSAAGSPNE